MAFSANIPGIKAIAENAVFMSSFRRFLSSIKGWFRVGYSFPRRIGSLLVVLGVLPSAHMGLAQPVSSEKFVARTWTKAEGLPNDSVTAVLQSSDGYLWVGTQGGLVKFDGASFKPVPLDYFTNTDVRITDMCEDRQNRIWVGTEKQGLFCCSNGTNRQVATERKIDSPITTLALGENDEIWVGTRKGLCLWNGKKLRWFKASDGLPEEAISSACVSRSGKVWITAHSGVYLYRDGVLGRYHFSTESQGRSPEFLGIFEDQQRELWAFGDTYLIKLGEGRRFNYFRNGQISSARIWSFHEARDGRLWIGTSGKGLFQFTGEGFRPVALRDGSVPGDVRSIYQDRERNVWLGTDGGGLVQLRAEHLRVLGKAEGLPDTQASGIAQNSAGQIIISFTGEAAFAGDGEHFMPYGPADLINAQQLVRTLCVASNGDAWFGSPSVGLLCLHGDRVVNFDSASGLAGNAVTYLQAGGSDKVWAGTVSGQIYRCERTGLKPAGNVGSAVTTMLASSNRLYVGTASGSVWRSSRNGFVPLLAKPDSLASPITSLWEDSEGRIWIGTLTNGLHSFHNRILTSWPAAERQAHLRIYHLLTDSDDNLWLTTSKGIALAEKPTLKRAMRSGTFPEIRIIEHLSVPEIESSGGPSGMRAKDGSLWFILQGRVIRVDPHTWRYPRTIPPVYIESVSVNDSEIQHVPMGSGLLGSGDQPSVRLPANVHRLDIDFTTPCLTSPERTHFRYRLEGIDGDWIEGNPMDRRAHYGVIPSGSYRFQVAAANPEGTWNTEGATFAFIVPIPLWRQPWLLAAELLALAGLAAWAARYLSHRRLRLRLSNLERSEEMSRERMRIAQDMHDEIGSKLARISFLSEVAKSEVKETPHQSDVVDSLAKTARDLLQSLDRMVWAVNPRNDSLESLASYLNRYASEYFQYTSIVCQLSIPSNLPVTPLSAEIRHNIFLSFEESLANAMKHSGATVVTVDLKVTEGQLQISVADNGAGFDPTLEPAALEALSGDDRLGLSGLRRRLQAVGGTCEIKSSPGHGTTIRLNLPLPQSHAN
jgi:signal transduction histidine kinase/ligand-binding sensor domain-containing protein